MVATGEHTIEAICDHVGIAKDTFYDWKKKKADFSDSLKAAEEKRLDNIGILAQSGLALLLTKHEYEETKTEFGLDKSGKPFKKSELRTKKFIMPNAAAVIFALTNRKPQHWKQRQIIAHTGEDGGPVQTETLIKVGYGNHQDDDEAEEPEV
jgi:hypothetical protein